jgi:hypothetical protein
MVEGRLMEHIIELVVVDNQVRKLKFFYVTITEHAQLVCNSCVCVTGTLGFFPGGPCSLLSFAHVPTAFYQG